MQECVIARHVARIYFRRRGEGGENIKLVTDYQHLTGKSELLARNLNFEGLQTSRTPPPRLATCLVIARSISAPHPPQVVSL